MDEGIRYSCPLCTSKFSSRSDFLRHMSDIHDIGANRGPYKREVTAQNVPDVRVRRHSCDLCMSTFSLRGSLLRHKRVIHGANRRLYKRQVTAQNNVPDVRVRRHSCDLCMSTFSLRGSLLRHKRVIHGANRRLYKRQVTAQNNVPDVRVRRHSCDLCMSTFSLRGSLLRHKRVIHDIDENHKPYKRQVTAQNNVPDDRVRRVVCQNEYKTFTLRNLHEEYIEAQHSQDKRLVWASHAGSLSRKLNLNMQVIAMLMLDIYADYSTPIDENLIEMLHQSSHFCTENIQHHTQYYIFVQLVYGLMKIYETGLEDLQSHRKSNWKKNTITILEYFQFTEDTADFIIERMENFL